jgi:alpha-beta hydrolase superfamily lysophospholipase
MPSCRAAVLLFACVLVSVPAQRAAAAEPAPRPTPCPAGLPDATRCLAGTDSLGAHVLIAVPAAWQGVLVLHAHGGPLLGAPRAERVVEDLQRWSIAVRAGLAWAGTSYRQGGVAVRAAAEDVERLRGLFIQHVATPRRTLLHGQSWGASVAAQGAEMFAAGRPYDGVLLSSGVLGGGSRSYDFRLDLRVVYQALCHNHPRAGEPDYPLWQGLPVGAALTQADLAARARECLGLGLPAAARSAEQAQRLATLLAVVRVPEKSLLGHLSWATWHFQDVAQNRSGGGNVFGNIGAVYRGSPDDAALNAEVERYRADPAAVARFAADTDPGGRIPVPVLGVHATQDPVAFVELESVWADTVRRAGTADHVVQVYTGHDEHSYLDDVVYATLFEALLRWIDEGTKPDPAALAARCKVLEARWGAGCRMLPDFKPQALDTRVAARRRP